MHKMIIKNSFVATMAVFSLAVALPAVTFAQPVRAEEAQTTARETVAEKRQARLADAKLRACQNREKAINNIMARMGDRGQRQINLFTKIAEKTQAFYVKKGKALSNYDALVTDVTAKKTSAQTAVQTTKSSVIDFKCDGTDPKGAVAVFKENLKAQNTALKAYKTAVKNLIVGVKSVQGSTTSAGNSTGGNQ